MTVFVTGELGLLGEGGKKRASGVHRGRVVHRDRGDRHPGGDPTNCRNTIHEAYLAGNDIPGADNWGCEVERPSRFIERIRTNDAGVIRLELGNEIGDLRLAIHYITLAPLNGSGQIMREEDLGTPVRRWRCGSAADGTDVKAEFLPSTCRGY